MYKLLTLVTFAALCNASLLWPFAKEAAPIESHPDFSKFVEQTNSVYMKELARLHEKKEDYRQNIRNWLSDFTVQTHKDEYFMFLDIPGMNKDDLTVHLDDNSVHVSGEHKCTDTSNLLPWKEDEITCIPRSIQASLELKKDADMNRVQVVFRDGVLKIRVPRMHRNLPLVKLQEKWGDITESVMDFINDTQEKVTNVVGDVVEAVDGVVDGVVHGAEKVMEHQTEAGKILVEEGKETVRHGVKEAEIKLKEEKLHVKEKMEL